MSQSVCPYVSIYIHTPLFEMLIKMNHDFHKCTMEGMCEGPNAVQEGSRRFQ